MASVEEQYTLEMDQAAAAEMVKLKEETCIWVVVNTAGIPVATFKSDVGCEVYMAGLHNPHYKYKVSLYP